MFNLQTFVLFASLILALKGWITWYRDLFSVNRLRGLIQQRFVLFLLPVVSLLLLAGVLKKLSATTVRNDASYIGLYLLLTLGWLGGATLVFPFLGASARDDVLERSNLPALWVVAGALLGVSCSFAGANIGNGPGVEAVLLSAVLSSGLFFILWLVVDHLTSVSERVTVERDESAGITMAGLLLSIGLLSGWSVAGNWTSASKTLRDFALFSWPAILLSGIATVVERVFRRTFRKASRTLPFVISVLYVGIALAWILARGFRS